MKAKGNLLGVSLKLQQGFYEKICEANICLFNLI